MPKLPNFLKDKEKRHKVIVILGTIYGYAWAGIKFIYEIISLAFLYCLSSISTLFTGINKHIYLKSIDDESKKKKNSFIMASFLIVIGLAYLSYSVFLFFVEQKPMHHSIIFAIVVALLSFIELGVAIHGLFNVRKKNDMTALSMKIMSFSLSLFDLVNTQHAIFTAKNVVKTYADALFGTVAGGVTILLRIYLLIRLWVYYREE